MSERPRVGRGLSPVTRQAAGNLTVLDAVDHVRDVARRQAPAHPTRARALRSHESTSFAWRTHLPSGQGNARVWGGDRLSRGRRPRSGCKLLLLDPHVARELRWAKAASGGWSRLRLVRVKYISRRLREGAVRRVSTPERLHCVDHPRLVGDPVGLRSAGTWREDPRSFSRNVACRRRGLKEWSNDVHRVRVDSARGAG